MPAPVYDSVLDMIGSTPMVRLNRVSEDVGPEILAKLEFKNPSCSVKDRIALNMIEEAERKGLLRPGSTIVEPTTGNTGIALSLVASLKGYRMIVVMPEFVSRERRIICENLGAEVVITQKEEGILGVLRKAQDLLDTIDNAFMPHQFSNQHNPLAHKLTTGREILEQTDGVLDVFVAAAGTGGTITGVAMALRERIPDVEIVIVEPAGSPILSGGRPGPHKIEGVGEGFVPDVLDTSIYDRVLTVSDGDAMEMARRLARREGLVVGISSGANIHAVLEVAREMDEGRIVTLLPDCGLRYLSTELFNCNRSD